MNKEFIRRSWELIKDAKNTNNSMIVFAATDELFFLIQSDKMNTLQDYISFKDEWYPQMKNMPSIPKEKILSRDEIVKKIIDFQSTIRYYQQCKKIFSFERSQTEIDNSEMYRDYQKGELEAQKNVNKYQNMLANYK